MSVISKDLAGQIATKLTEASRIESDKLHVEFRELVTKFYEDQTPDEVKKCLKNNPDWISTKQSVRLHGHGFDWEYISTTRPIICNDRDGGDMKMTSKISDQLMTLKRKWEKAKDKYKTLKDETKQALLTLKTYNNIRKEIPLAAPMLPPPISNALVVSFDSLKRRLSNQPDSKKTVPN